MIQEFIWSTISNSNMIIYAVLSELARISKAYYVHIVNGISFETRIRIMEYGVMAFFMGR